MATRTRKPAAQGNTRRSTKGGTKDFGAAMAGFEKILTPYGRTLKLSIWASNGLMVSGTPTKKYPGGMMFAAARPMKNYVSYHLMPIYMNPELQARISPELKVRMQGKACFNFTAPDPALFKELADLTRRGYDGFRKMGYVP